MFLSIFSRYCIWGAGSGLLVSGNAHRVGICCFSFFDKMRAEYHSESFRLPCWACWWPRPQGKTSLERNWLFLVEETFGLPIFVSGLKHIINYRYDFITISLFLLFGFFAELRRYSFSPVFRAFSNDKPWRIGYEDHRVSVVESRL